MPFGPIFGTVTLPAPTLVPHHHHQHPHHPHHRRRGAKLPSTPRARFPPGTFGTDSPTTYYPSSPSAMASGGHHPAHGFLPPSAGTKKAVLQNQKRKLKAELGHVMDDFNHAKDTAQRVKEKLSAAEDKLARLTTTEPTSKENETEPTKKSDSDDSIAEEVGQPSKE